MKKITVKMLKEGITINSDEISEVLFDTFKKLDKLKGMKNIPDDVVKPLDESDQDIFVMLGMGSAFVMKHMCTPAAWKIVVEELRKAMKES